MNKYYYIVVYSYFDEDGDDPYCVRFDSMEDALNAFHQYDTEHLLSGQKAFNVSGPYVSEGDE